MERAARTLQQLSLPGARERWMMGAMSYQVHSTIPGSLRFEMAMDEKRARAILGGMVGYNAAANVGYARDTTCLDGDYTIEELEALVWWLRNHPGEQFPEFVEMIEVPA